MTDGTLPMEKFRYYIIQDYGYLLEFIRCLALSIAKTDNLDELGITSKLLNDCVNSETTMLERLGSELGIGKEVFQNIKLEPTNYGYTRHLLNVAYSGTFYENLAALLPCMWTYKLIGEEKVKLLPRGINRHYRDWIEFYSTESYANLVGTYINLIDRAEESLGSSIKAKMVLHFKISSRYEYLFWDMAYRMETWP